MSTFKARRVRAAARAELDTPLSLVPSGRFRNAIFQLLVLAVTSITATAAATQPVGRPGDLTITEYPVTPGSQPVDIVAGPDCDIWFSTTADPSNALPVPTTPIPTVLGRMDVETGEYVEYGFGTDEQRLAGGLTLGPDEAIWFTEPYNNKIARFDRAGTLTEYVLPSADTYPQDLTVGPDGSLWLTAGFAAGLVGSEKSIPKIIRMTLSGEFTEFELSRTEFPPHAIVAGPDGNMWFTRPLGNFISRITSAGEVTNFAVPTPSARPDVLTIGPDGAIWFTERLADKIGRLTLDGEFTEFPLPGTAPLPIPAPLPVEPPPPLDVTPERLGGITTGPDGNIWAGKAAGDGLVRVTPSGDITMVPTPSGATTSQVSTGPDGALWFTEQNADQIGRVDFGVPGTPGPCGHRNNRSNAG